VEGEGLVLTGGSRGQSGHGPGPRIMVLGGLAPTSQAVAGSVKGRWIMEISLFFLLNSLMII